MNTFWNIIEWIMGKLKVIGAACLAGMTLLTCVDVVGRFFRHPIFGSEEIVGFMATLAVAMALPFTDKIKGHVGVEILMRLFSDRTQMIVNICTRVLSLALFAIITWQLALYARALQESGEVSMALELPEYAVVYISSFCILILSLIIVQDIICNIKKLAQK